MEKVRHSDLGRISYRAAWTRQEELFAEVVAAKLKRRESAAEESGSESGLVERAAQHSKGANKNGLHYFLFCEHNPVFTLGRNGDAANLLLDEKKLAKQGIEFYRINRGGDITFHGPGQVVGYPIFDLDYFFTDIGKYLRMLEEGIIRLLADYGLKGERLKGATGVWLDADNPFKARKICAMGIRASRWVTMHGFALNVNTDLGYFDKIVPCGITDKAVTSLQKEVGREIDLGAVKTALGNHLAELFGFEFVPESNWRSL